MVKSKFSRILLIILPCIAAGNPLVSLVQKIHAGFPAGKLEAIESRFGWIMWVIRKSRKQQPNLMQVSGPHAEIRWKIDCISSFLFFGMEWESWLQGAGDFSPTAFLKFISISGWNFKAHCYDHSRGGQHSLYSRDSDFMFDSWEAASSFILWKAKIWCSLFCFCPETLLFHSFIKALNTFERNFFIKKESFFVCLFVLPNFVPWTTCAILLAVLGAWFRQGQHHPGDTGWGFVLSLACWCWQWDWAAAGWSQAAPALPFLRARVLTRVPALVSSLGNHVLLHELPPAVSGIWTILTSQLQDCSMQGGLHFRAGWSISPKHTLHLPRIMQKNPPILLTPAGSGFRILFPGFAKLYLN